MAHSNILLESGTNELEIVEFSVGNSVYGINVAKVHRILVTQPVTKIPNSHPCIEGIFRLENLTIPIIDLAKYLNLSPSENPAGDKLIVAEFNQLFVAFHVHSVSRIHRISWTDIEKPSDIVSSQHGGAVIGVIKMTNYLNLLLDFEKIVADISPETGVQVSDVKKLGPRERSHKSILFAEDSDMLGKMMLDVLHHAGYENVIRTSNGQEAWNLLQELGQKYDDITEAVQLIITDIEMPQMDGHHLTRKIKDDPRFQKLPVIIFSSLINDQMYQKGKSVGADDQITKPEIVELIKRVDKLIL